MLQFKHDIKHAAKAAMVDLRGFAMILTDAKIPSDPLLYVQICTRCGRYIDICPLHALNGGETEEIKICGIKMNVAFCDWKKCAICENGAVNDNAGIDRLSALCVRTCVPLRSMH